MTAARRRLRRISLIRLGVTLAIVATAALAIGLPGGLFRLAFRGVLVVGAAILIGSYVVEWWLRRRRRAQGGRVDR